MACPTVPYCHAWLVRPYHIVIHGLSDRTILSSMACPTVPYCHPWLVRPYHISPHYRTYSTIFGEKNFLSIKYLLIFYINFFMKYLSFEEEFSETLSYMCGPDSSVCIARLATGWTVWGSNPGRGEFFRTCPDRRWGAPSLLYNGYRVFPPGVKSGRGVTLTPHPLLVPLVMKE